MKAFSPPHTVPVPDFADCHDADGRYDRAANDAAERLFFNRLNAELRLMGYTGPLTGEVVYFPQGDGSAIYMVADGRTTALIHCPLGDAWSLPEWQTRGLRKADIVAQVDRRRKLAALFQAGDDWWAAQPIGTVLHYHNGFGEYVRGTVVERDGKHTLLPTALVGNWHGGHISHHAHSIAVGNAWQPNTGCVYEAPGFVPPRGPAATFDPTTATPISLEAA